MGYPQLKCETFLTLSFPFLFTPSHGSRPVDSKAPSPTISPWSILTTSTPHYLSSGLLRQFPNSNLPNLLQSQYVCYCPSDFLKRSSDHGQHLSETWRPCRIYLTSLALKAINPIYFQSFITSNNSFIHTQNTYPLIFYTPVKKSYTEKSPQMLNSCLLQQFTGMPYS